MCIRDRLGHTTLGGKINKGCILGECTIMGLKNGYGLVIGQKSDYFRDPPDNFGRYYHGNVIIHTCLLYTSDAADDLLCVDLGGRRIIKKKKKITHNIIK